MSWILKKKKKVTDLGGNALWSSLSWILERFCDSTLYFSFISTTQKRLISCQKNKKQKTETHLVEPETIRALYISASVVRLIFKVMNTRLFKRFLFFVCFSLKTWRDERWDSRMLIHAVVGGRCLFTVVFSSHPLAPSDATCMWIVWVCLFPSLR